MHGFEEKRYVEGMAGKRVGRFNGGFPQEIIEAISE
jgi:hypothetical protein